MKIIETCSLGECAKNYISWWAVHRVISTMGHPVYSILNHVQLFRTLFSDQLAS